MRSRGREHHELNLMSSYSDGMHFVGGHGNIGSQGDGRTRHRSLRVRLPVRFRRRDHDNGGAPRVGLEEANRPLRPEMTVTSPPFDQTTAYRHPISDAVAALDTDAERGLSQGEARARLDRYGRKELTGAKPVPAWRKFHAQFHDVLVVLLLVATAISAALWLYERHSALPYEAMAIFAVVLLSAVMGYVQQSRAEQAVAALRRMSATDAHVIRDDARQTVLAAELVPRDVILVEEGDTIPADARLIESTALQAAEAALTGESVPVAKDTRPIDEEAGLGDRHNMVFNGTAATYGHGRAVVVATGMQPRLRSAAASRCIKEESRPRRRCRLLEHRERRLAASQEPQRVDRLHNRRPAHAELRAPASPGSSRYARAASRRDRSTMRSCTHCFSASSSR